jgi:hypothetical protein
VAAALEDGTYGELDLSGHRDRLETIFPLGVCDYDRPDPVRPTGLFGGAEPRVADAGGA